MARSMLQTLTLVLLLQGNLGQDPEMRIIGGNDCHEDEFPFIASLTLFEEHFCGCSIISPNWVLTAGHCTFRQSHESLQIEYGSVSMDSPEVKKVNVSKIVMHPEYAEFFNQYALNDIALLKTEPEMTLSEHAQSVKLPEMGAPTPENETGVAIGWGYVNRTHSDVPKILQKVQLPILTDEKCRALGLISEVFHPFQMCASTCDPELDEDVFRGDSGGPFLVSNVQVGITSFGDRRPRDGPYLPSVFTKVSYYIDWITETVKAN